MSALATFMYTGGGLLLVLLLLFIIPKLKVFLKSRKREEKKREVKVVEVRVIQKNGKKSNVNKKILIKGLIFPFVLVVLLGLFLIFESQVVEFIRGYAIELSPINYVSLFTLVGLIFITRGAVLTLQAEKVNNGLKAFVWIMHGFVLTVVALMYDLLHYTHLVLFGRSFSALLILLVIWEIVVLLGIFRSYKKVF